jgi:hypothetical protein
MGDTLDAPNQQVVRPDESGPWEEGSGGSENPAPKDETPADDPEPKPEPVPEPEE